MRGVFVAAVKMSIQNFRRSLGHDGTKQTDRDLLPLTETQLSVTETQRHGESLDRRTSSVSLFLFDFLR